MKRLTVPFISPSGLDKESFSDRNELLNDIAWEPLAEVNWKQDYPYQPEVKFRIAYTDRSFLVQFRTVEEQLKGAYSYANQNVWEDSCVELFLSFDGGINYYNIEFNLIGTGVVGYGPALKSNRKRLDPDEIETIETFVQINRLGNYKCWDIIEEIPYTLFKFDDLSDLSGKTILGNFYKCGDKLDKPHFLSWNKIENPTPNFHLPQYFGEIVID